MITFLPVSRYRVTLVVGAGRPYSAFERYLLRAISGNVATIDGLVESFRIHRRIIVEGLVSLLHARFIGLATDPEGARFVLTRFGQAACTDDAVLSNKQVSVTRSTTVVMEHVSGQLTRSAVALRTKRDLKNLGYWELGMPIRSRIRSNVLEPGQVRPFLSVRSDANEYIHSIERIELAGTTSFVLVEVDPISHGIQPGSIPRDWETLLLPRIAADMERVTRGKEGLAKEVDDKALRQLRLDTPPLTEESFPSSETWPVRFHETDVICGSKMHLALIKDRLVRAATMVVISSAYLDAAAINHLAPYLKAAVTRGVCVDVLWGLEPRSNRQDGHSKAIRLLHILQDEVHTSGGRLLVVSEPCKSNARLCLKTDLS